jgi:hypothetical protein
MANEPTFAQDKSLPDEPSLNINRRVYNVKPRKPKVEKLIQEGKELEKKSSEYARPPSQVVPDQSKSVFSRWPTLLASTDKDDAIYELQQKLTDQSGVVPNIGQAIVDKDFFEYQRRKSEQAELARFKVWFYKQMDLSTPEKRNFWETKFPEVFDDRKKLMEQQFDVAKRMALINIFGPRTMDDFVFMYLVQEGKIEIPKGAIFDPASHPYDNFQRGFFNIKNLFPPRTIRTGRSDAPFRESFVDDADTKAELFKNNNQTLWPFGERSNRYQA